MKKQIVVLMTDTTRKDMVGCYGNEKMKTPNLDRLAQEDRKSTRLNSSHSQQSRMPSSA